MFCSWNISYSLWYSVQENSTSIRSLEGKIKKEKPPEKQRKFRRKSKLERFWHSDECGVTQLLNKLKKFLIIKIRNLHKFWWILKVKKICKMFRKSLLMNDCQQEIFKTWNKELKLMPITKMRSSKKFSGLLNEKKAFLLFLDFLEFCKRNFSFDI